MFPPIDRHPPLDEALPAGAEVIQQARRA